MLPELNVIVLELFEIALWSALALVAGGVCVLLGVVGMALSLVSARQPAPEAERSRHRPLIIGSVFFLIIGSALLGVGIMYPLGASRTPLAALPPKLVNAYGVFRAAAEAQLEQANRDLLKEPKYQDPKKLNRYEYRVFSQNGEDGIIAEVFKRIGTTNRYFVDFGSSDGFENNTVLLLRQGWSGLWIDADAALVNRAKEHFRPEIEGHKLTVIQAFITAENIEDLFGRGEVPNEFDLLSIDIDRNDYYIWEKISQYRPRVVVIEYNSLYPPTMSWVIPYDPKAYWDGTTRTGATLKALEELGTKKGYSLVGSTINGLNAFFVRDDLLGDHFAAPYTAENHYEPSRRPAPATMRVP